MEEKNIEKFNPLVSIIIPVYNGANYMREAIDSALDQTYKNIEVIVVNDGSTDDTEKIAESYGDKIRYFPKKNGGVATALNLAIKEAHGEYISWLSHDDVYLPEKIEKQIDFLSNLDDKNSILYCNVRYIDKNSNPISYTSYELKYSHEELNNGFFCLLHGYANGCAMLIPRICFDKLGLFDETTRTSNDYEMWLRLFKKYDVRFVPNILIEYRLHDGQDTNMSPVYQKESSRLWKKIIQELKENEILSFNNNLFAFYFNMALQMKESQCIEACEISYQKAKEYFSLTKRKVSIIMPCFNTEKYLSEAIDSVLRQTFCDFELIIIDDSSTDKSLDIIKAYAEKDFRIIFSENKNKKGIAGAMNTGFELANGEYITRMDSDDISLQQRLEKQVSFLDKNSSYGICSVNISSMDSKGKVLSESLFSKTSVPLAWLFLWKNPIANAPAMYRKEIIECNSTVFDTNLKSAEDYDFLCKNILRTKCFQINEPLYRYRIHNESVFQKNINETCENSIVISRRLAKEITGENPPLFHDELTVFLSNVKKTTEKYDVGEMKLWMNKLLNNAKKQWHWNEDEYNSAFNDAKKRIRNYISQQNKENATNNSENVDILNVENLQISDNDLIGNKFNGHDLHFYLRDRNIDSKQLVWNKESMDENTFKIARSKPNREEIYEQTLLMQKQYSLNGILNPLGYDILRDPLFLNTDVVHLHLIHNHIFDIQLLPLMSRFKPIVWTLHDPWALGGHCIHHFDCEKWKKQCGDCSSLKVPFGLQSDNSALNFALKKDAIKNSNFEIVVASEWMKRKVEQSPIFEGKKINIIPFGINQEIFKPSDRSDLRKKLGIQKDALAILFRSDHSGFKGMDVINYVLKNIHSKKSIVLLVLKDKLKENSKNFEVKEYGWVNDDKLLAQIYSASDIFLMPSTVEAFGMMAIESMSCGTLPIVLDGTALPDTVNAPECGVATKRDKEEYLKAVQYYIDHEDERNERAKKCLEFARKNYNKDDYVDKIIKVYEEAMIKHKLSEEDKFLLEQLKKNVVPGTIKVDSGNFLDPLLMKYHLLPFFLKYKNIFPEKIRLTVRKIIIKLYNKFKSIK